MYSVLCIAVYTAIRSIHRARRARAPVRTSTRGRRRRRSRPASALKKTPLRAEGDRSEDLPAAIGTLARWPVSGCDREWRFTVRARSGRGRIDSLGGRKSVGSGGAEWSVRATGRADAHVAAREQGLDPALEASRQICQRTSFDFCTRVERGSSQDRAKVAVAAHEPILTSPLSSLTFSCKPERESCCTCAIRFLHAQSLPYHTLAAVELGGQF